MPSMSALALGGIVGATISKLKPIMPKPPPPPAPMPVPVDQDPAALAALRRKTAMDAAGGSGRDTTIMTDQLG